MKYLLYKDDREEDWFIPRTGERYEFYVKSPISWKNICDVRTIYRTVRKIRNYGVHNIRLQVDEADWQLICEKYPWFSYYDNEVQHKLGTLLLKLLAFSIRDGMTDVEQEIFTQNGLDEDSLKALTVGEPAEDLLICKNRLHLQKDRLCADFKWKNHGRGVYCIYREGNDYFHDGGFRHYVTEAAKAKLNEEIRRVRALRQTALDRNEGFQILETADVLLAFRPLPDDLSLKEINAVMISSRNRKYYQFLLISKTDDDVMMRFCEWKDVIGDYNGKNFSSNGCGWSERREAFLKDHARTVMRIAEDVGDLYLLYTFKGYFHEQTEDECEFLQQMDGEPHYVAWQEEKTAGTLTILDAACGGFSMFNRRPRYFCRILLEGKTYNTVWDPQYLQDIRITEYHHTVIIHLSEDQVKLFWEKTNADPDSGPFPGMPRK